MPRRKKSGASLPSTARINWSTTSPACAPMLQQLRETARWRRHECGRQTGDSRASACVGGHTLCSRSTNVEEGSPATGGRCCGRFPPCVCFFMVELPDLSLPLLPLPARRASDAAPGVLHRAGHRLCGLCAAPCLLLDDFWLAGGRALVGAGLLARTVCRAGSIVPKAIRAARDCADSIHLDGSGIFPR